MLTFSFKKKKQKKPFTCIYEKSSSLHSTTLVWLYLSDEVVDEFNFFHIRLCTYYWAVLLGAGFFFFFKFFFLKKSQNTSKLLLCEGKRASCVHPAGDGG